MISHWSAPQRLEQTCPHFVVINATLCRTSLIHIVGSVVLSLFWSWMLRVCLGCCLSSKNMCARHVRAHLGLIFVGDC